MFIYFRNTSFSPTIDKVRFKLRELESISTEIQASHFSNSSSNLGNYIPFEINKIESQVKK